MSEKTPEPDIVIGKQWRGQQHVPITTPAAVEADLAIQRSYNKPDAISIDAYFARLGVRDPVRIAGMKAYTAVRHATFEDWNNIFTTY